MKRYFLVLLTLIHSIFSIASYAYQATPYAQVAASGAPQNYTERLAWKEIPLDIQISVNQQRVIKFPKPGYVRVGVPGNIKDSLLVTEIIDSTVYWTAKAEFTKTQVPVVNPVTGETFLIHLSATSAPGNLHPVEVLSHGGVGFDQSGQASTTTGVKDQAIDYVTLTRFAAQQMYSPARLLKDHPGITRVPIEAELTKPLVRGHNIEALPLVQWQGGGYYISAVRLRNLSSQSIVLDPRQLRGQWLAATFQHSRLHPHGHIADVTTVYLISEAPFKL